MFLKFVKINNTFCLQKVAKLFQSIILYKKAIASRSDYIVQHHTFSNFNHSDSWVILSPIEQRIKEKIERVGTPLKDWDIQINYGIKTGFNEAFIISGEKRKELMEKDPKSEEIIRPILRGRDIKRYSYDFADLYLIATFPSLKIDIEEYPAVKEHLMNFGYDRLKQTGEKGARKKTNNKWFETQDTISYWDLFYKQKICWKAVGRNLAFSLVEAGVFLTAPASFISSDNNEYILAFLCSNIGKYFVYQNSDTTGAGDIMLNIQSLIQFPIPKQTNATIDFIKNEILTILNNLKNKLPIIDNHKMLDNYIYEIYGFNKEEIKVIESV